METAQAEDWDLDHDSADIVIEEVSVIEPGATNGNSAVDPAAPIEVSSDVALQASAESEESNGVEPSVSANGNLAVNQPDSLEMDENQATEEGEQYLANEPMGMAALTLAIKELTRAINRIAQRLDELQS